MYDSDSLIWSQLPKLKTSRTNHGCGLATNTDGTSFQAVVAGGSGVKTVEVFDFIANEWRYFIEKCKLNHGGRSDIFYVVELLKVVEPPIQVATLSMKNAT